MRIRGYSTTITIALLFVGLLVGAGVGYLSSSNVSQSKISEKESQISVLGSEVSSLNSKVSTLEEEISNYKLQISDFKSEVSDMESDLDKADSTITLKEVEITGLELEISDLELMASVLKTDIKASARATSLTFEGELIIGSEGPGEVLYAEGVLYWKNFISSGGNITFLTGDILGTHGKRLESDYVFVDYQTGQCLGTHKLIITIEGRGTFEGSQRCEQWITYDEAGN
jgi:outer membrane murein-binding lipoprotein Lpp